MTTPQVDVVETARKVVERDKARRAAACEAAINEVLRQHGCTLDVHLVPAGTGLWGYRIEVKAE